MTTAGGLELMMVAGNYRSVAYLTNALRLPLEGFASRFPVRRATPRPGLAARRRAPFT